MKLSFSQTRSLWIVVIALAALAVLLFASIDTALSKESSKKLSLTSSAFKNGQDIPLQHAYVEVPGGQNISFPLRWTLNKKTAAKTKSFAITTIDLHPIAQKYVHLMMVNIPGNVRSLDAGSATGYIGPYPPPGTGKHIYETTLYALNVEEIEIDPSKELSGSALKKLLKGKIVATAKLRGKFEVKE